MQEDAKKSYVHGVGARALSGRTIDDCLRDAIDAHPDGKALAVPYENSWLTYQQLGMRVDQMAAGLIYLGLLPGDRVGILAPNCEEWIILQFATARVGLVLVNLNPAYQVTELSYALGKVSCKAIFTVESFKSSQYINMLTQFLPSLPASKPGELNEKDYPDLRHVIVLGDKHIPGCWNSQQIRDLADDTSSIKAREYANGLQFDDVINIQFTSGTTGSPKASALTHHNIVNNARFVGEQMRLSPADSICVPVPMYHCFGMVLGSLCAVTHHAETVLCSAGFDAASVLETIHNERCTALHGVPTMFIAELEHPRFREFDLGSLRTGIMAGAPCPEELMNRVIRDMHLEELTIAYGMTETGPVSFQTTIDDSTERRVTTVGRVLPHVEVKIVDKNKHVVHRGVEGELLTRGYCVMPYYWNDPERTAAAIDQSGWIASGDIATIDKEGYCRIVGRLKDMLIRGGENIFPREIEEFLYRFPGMEQVEVFGVSDARLGEQVCAWVKLKPGHDTTVEDIIEFCKGQIAHYKVPKYIRFVDDFPMTVTGKVQKFRMREEMEAELADNTNTAKPATAD